ncbi:MAG: hypothetical protein ABJA98_35170 [Acidobacteriota bacterium]
MFARPLTPGLLARACVDLRMGEMMARDGDRVIGVANRGAGPHVFPHEHEGVQRGPVAPFVAGYSLSGG